MTNSADQVRQEILNLCDDYFTQAFPPKGFIPGESPVPVSGKMIDADDLKSMMNSVLDGWFTTGRFAEEFEKKLARFVGVRCASLVNSGSSANLVALSALTSPKLGDSRLKPGDEVITVAAGFPTTVNPIIQNRLVPVFVDVTVPTYEIDVSRLEAARSEKTRAIMVAHTLGNAFDLDAVVAFAKKYDLWLIEDCCDALGTTYKGRNVGTFGDLATISFYPAHHITMGEGGAVLTDKPNLQVLVESFRDWGRDCWCHTGKDNTCGKRFDWQLGAASLRLRSQVHLFAHWLQPEGHRYAGGAGGDLSSQSCRISSNGGKRISHICATGSTIFRICWCCRRRPQVLTRVGSVFRSAYAPGPLSIALN